MPAAPGIRPSLTSGRPSFALGAAERGAVDRGDHRLVARLHRVERVGQARPLRRLAELGDVGPGEERAPVAAYDDSLDRVVGQGGLDRLLEPGADRLAERVDGRVVRHDDKHLAVAVSGDRVAHGRFPKK